MMIAIATAASAAAMAIINTVKNKPSSCPGQRYLLKAIKFRFTLFSIKFNAHQHGDQVSPGKKTIYPDKE